MSNQIQLPQDVIDTRNKAVSLGQTAANYQAGAGSVEEILRQKVQNAYNNSQDIIGPLDQQVQSYYGAPAAAREKYQNVTNPFTRENLVAQYQGNTAIPMLSSASILGQRFGRISDLIGSGVSAYGAQTDRAIQAYQAERQNYMDALDEFKTMTQLNQEQQRINKPSGSGGGSDLEDIFSIMAALTGEQNGQSNYLNAPPSNSQFAAKVNSNPEQYIQQLPGNDQYAIVQTANGYEIYKVNSLNEGLGSGEGNDIDSLWP